MNHCQNIYGKYIRCSRSVPKKMYPPPGVYLAPPKERDAKNTQGKRKRVIPPVYIHLYPAT